MKNEQSITKQKFETAQSLEDTIRLVVLSIALKK